MSSERPPAAIGLVVSPLLLAILSGVVGYGRWAWGLDVIERCRG